MAMNKKLGKRTDIRLHIIKNQATELLWNGKIETTVDRAKSVRRVAEKIITLAINTYEDVVKVTKDKLNQKNESIKVEYENDGPKKLAARRKIMASIYLKPEEQQAKEKKADFKTRTAEINNPIIEKIFREYAPKYAKRADDLKQKGGITRIIKIGNRRGDNAEMCYIELVD